MKHKRKSCLDASQNFLFYLGLWPVNENQKGYRFYLMRIVFPRAMIFRCIYSLIFQSINVELVWKETYRVVEHSMQIIFYLLMGTKYTTFFIYRHRFRDLFNGIELLNDRLVKGSKSNAVILDRSQKMCSIINKIPIPLTIICGVLGSSFLLPMGLRNRIIPLRLWFPYDASYTPMFELTFVTAGTLLICDVGVICICDTLFCIIVLQLACHFEMLRNDLQHMSRIIEERVKEVNVKSTPGIVKDTHEIAPERAHNMYQCHNSVAVDERRINAERKRIIIKSLVSRYQGDFVRNHYTLNQLTKEVQDLFKIILAVQIMTNLSQAVNVLYVSTLAESFDPKAMLILGTVLFGMTELFVYCMSAGYLSDVSAKLHYAAYACDWVHMPKTFKSSLCIIMSRSRHAFIMRAAGIPLSRRTLRAIYKATYYLHTLLHKIYFGEKFVQRKV